jgi:hypothetical protein
VPSGWFTGFQASSPALNATSFVAWSSDDAWGDIEQSTLGFYAT